MHLLIDLTLRGTGAFLVVLILDRLMGSRMRASGRRLWWLLIPISFLLPWKAAIVPLRTINKEIFPSDFLDVEIGMRNSVQSTGFLGGNFLNFHNILWTLWIAGVALSLLVLLANTIRVSRFWASRRLSTDTALLNLLEDCKAKVGIHAPIGLIVSSDIQVPAIMGWLRPKIILPETLARNGGNQTLSHALLHELAHFRAWDIPIGWLFALARCMHWFNPFAWLAEHAWKNYRENAADETVINHGVDATAYGATLLGLIRQNHSYPPFGSLAIGESFSSLKQRIQMIQNHSTKTTHLLLTTIITALLMGVAILNPARADENDQKAIAVATMETWLKGIDEGNYEKSWKTAAPSFRKALSASQWIAALDAVRKPLGKCNSRTLASAMLQTNIPKGNGEVIEGDFVIAQFTTSFTNLAHAIETVTFERDGNDWKASGYFIKPDL